MSADAPMSSSQPSPAVYDVRPYKPDGGAEGSGILMLVSALAFVGAALGFAAHWVSQYFYLIILFPILIGFVVGAVGVRMVRQGRVRNPLIGGLAGFIGGALAMLMMHYFDYRSFRDSLAELDPEWRTIAQLPAAEREQLLAEVEDVADREQLAAVFRAAAVGSFGEYMQYAAHEGVEISSSRGSGNPMNLGYYGTWIYWGIEMLIVAGITYAMVRGSTADPYCRECGAWKEQRTLGGFHGESAASALAATDALESGQLDRFRAAGANNVVGSLPVTASCCPRCAGEIDLKVEHATVDGKGNVQKKALAHVTYPRAALDPLSELFSKPHLPQQ